MIPKRGLQIGTGPDDINLEQFKSWMIALRSGEFPQSRGRLQDEKGYCVVGVACAILIPLEDQELDKQGFLDGGGPTFQNFSPSWLRSVNGDFGRKTGHDLYYYNDDLRLSFHRMADLLENEYLTPYYESTGNTVQQ